MPPRKKSALENDDAKAIFNELKLYATDKQFLLVQNALFNYMTKPQHDPITRVTIPARYPDLPLGRFNYWFNRLVEDGYIVVDRASRAIRPTPATITFPDSDEFD